MQGLLSLISKQSGHRSEPSSPHAQPAQLSSSQAQPPQASSQPGPSNPTNPTVSASQQPLSSVPQQQHPQHSQLAPVAEHVQQSPEQLQAASSHPGQYVSTAEQGPGQYSSGPAGLPAQQSGDSYAGQPGEATFGAGPGFQEGSLGPAPGPSQQQGGSAAAQPGHGQMPGMTGLDQMAFDGARPQQGVWRPLSMIAVLMPSIGSCFTRYCDDVLTYQWQHSGQCSSQDSYCCHSIDVLLMETIKPVSSRRQHEATPLCDDPLLLQETCSRQSSLHSQMELPHSICTPTPYPSTAPTDFREGQQPARTLSSSMPRCLKGCHPSRLRLHGTPLPLQSLSALPPCPSR